MSEVPSESRTSLCLASLLQHRGIGGSVHFLLHVFYCLLFFASSISCLRSRCCSRVGAHIDAAVLTEVAVEHVVLSLTGRRHGKAQGS